MFWVAVKLDIGDQYIVVGFRNLTQAEKLEDKLNHIGDHKIFSVDLYGECPLDEIRKEYNPIEIFENPKVNNFTIERIYNEL